jgi:dienelactone hydrolase
MSPITKQKLAKYCFMASLILNLAFAAEHGIAYLGAKTGVVHADVQFDGFSVGGGTAEHAAREQQLAALSAALPASAIKPPPVKPQPDNDPMPGRKPEVQ